MAEFSLDLQPFAFCLVCRQPIPEPASTCPSCERPIPSKLRNLSAERAYYLQAYHKDDVFVLYGENDLTRQLAHERAILYSLLVRKRITGEEFRRRSEELSAAFRHTQDAVRARKSGCAMSVLSGVVLSLALLILYFIAG